MKLNPDLVREILLTIENTLGYGEQLVYKESNADEFETLNKYDYHEVLYHVNQCEMAGLIVGVTFFLSSSDGCWISDLSPKGHEFLANIRTESLWNKTKETAKKVGSFSLNTLAQIAIGVVSTSINDHI